MKITVVDPFKNAFEHIKSLFWDNFMLMMNEVETVLNFINMGSSQMHQFKCLIYI